MANQKQEQTVPMYDNDGNINYLWREQHDKIPETPPIYDNDGNINYLHRQ
jgi:hypothetical protein